MAGAAAAAAETVNFASRDGKTNLTAHLSRPAGDAPRLAPALVHGCSGLLNANGRMLPIYQAWTRALVVQGYVVLAVDGASSRGFGQTCSAGPDRVTIYRDRPELPVYRSGDGPNPVIGTDSGARADAFVGVREFLKLHLESN
jgi:hypothetical protein